jgi:hypothetical protein
MQKDVLMTTRHSSQASRPIPTPPQLQNTTIIHGDQAMIELWLTHYAQKLQLPEHELHLLAMTQDRQEFARWTGKRLNIMALGCYCYLSPRVSKAFQRSQHEQSSHRHLIFIEPDMQPLSLEVTIAHELIHMADRVNGSPRRHRHHGYDAIAVDEAAVTGYSMEELRVLLHEESERRERIRRERRPIRYIYECPHCGKSYPRTRKYAQSVSCSSCDKSYNPQFRLFLAQAQ